MEERSILIGLHELEGIGWETLKLITDTLPDLCVLLERPASEALVRAKLPARKVKDIERFLTNEFIDGKLRFYKECGVIPVTIYDEAYPPLLRFIPQPPWVLYTIGNLELLQQSSVAIVGTRYPTAYGREVAEWLGYELAEAGLPVVSGLARGIDSYAHAGALRANGATIAVLGNGLNVRYPPEHHALQRAIEERGLVISEYPWNTKPVKGTFPWRNRIIAGVSRGTVVVEAAAKSGSLITATNAIDCNRDVFAVPGPITSPKSAGAYDLIRSGAKMVISPQDVAEDYGAVTRSANPASGPGAREPLTAEEEEVLSKMGAEAVTIDELMNGSLYSFGHLHTVLLSLLVKNRIRALPGSLYIARLQE